MRSNPFLRKRVPSEPVYGGVAQSGFGGPYYLGPDNIIPPGVVTGWYHFHEGDVFFPGAPSFVYETPTERTPINTIWGNGGLLVHSQHVTMPYQNPQVLNYPRVFTSGLGGLQAGEFYMQPLLDPGGEVLPVSP